MTAAATIPPGRFLMRGIVVGFVPNHDSMQIQFMRNGDETGAVMALDAELPEPGRRPPAIGDAVEVQGRIRNGQPADVEILWWGPRHE